MSKSIHVTILIPDSTVHIILGGYKDVINTILCGLKELGFVVSFKVNNVRDDVRNIIFRAETVPPYFLKTLRPDTIIYNLEQCYYMFGSSELPEGNLRKLRESFLFIRQNFEIWDYSEKNVEAMNSINSCMPVKHVPIGYSPILERIERPEIQDIDVLIYGMPHDYRLKVYKYLCESWINCVFGCGIYGSTRDELIGRSKIVLNISGGNDESIYAIVRASYLLANKKLVISDTKPNQLIERDISEAVILEKVEYIPRICKYFLSDEDARHQAENKGYNIMIQRDIRSILLSALEN